jgi:hypothetical protein
MHSTRSSALTLSLTLLCALPAAAGTLYVPLLTPAQDNGTHTTEVWVSNSDSAQHPYTATFLAENTDGTKGRGSSSPAPAPAGRTLKLTNLVASGTLGLLELDLAEKVAATARLTNTTTNGFVSYATVPVISSANAAKAGEIAFVQGLGRDPKRGETGDFGVVNLGKVAAHCSIKFFVADGAQLGPTASLTFQPLSLRFFNDALFLIGQLTAADVRAQVSCDQPFYAFATYRRQSDGLTYFIPQAQTGASTLTTPGGSTPPPPPPTSDGLVFTAPGTFHVASRENEKKTFNIPVQHAMSLKRLIVDVDVTPGPWNMSKPNPNHALAWVHRGKFRSNSVVNLNAFGPDKYAIKMNQNVDLPAGQLRVGEAGYQLERGTLYHVKCVYDALAGKATVTLSSGGQTLRSFQLDTTAANHILSVPATGLDAEFGHYSGQEGPEVPSWGWAYANFRLEMVPY